MTRRTTILLLLIAALALGLRLIHIGVPPTDFPADRQINTAILVEAWSGGRPQDGFTYLRSASGDSRNGFTFNVGRVELREPMPEFPLVPCLAAPTARLLRLDPFHAFRAARAWTVVFSILSLLLLFDLGRRLVDEETGLWAAFLFAVTPASVYFGRAIIPDVPMTTLMLAVLCAADRAVAPTDRKRLPTIGWTVAVFGLLSLAVLTKIYAALIVAPLIWMFVSRGAVKPRARFLVCVLAVLVVLPAFGYYSIWPWSFFDDIARLSVGTNSAIETLAGYGLTAPYWRAFLNRVELTLTAGGALLALAGAAVLFARGRGGPVLLWFALGVAFVFGFVGANVYWTYLLLAPACLCAGAALSVAFSAAGQWSASRPRRFAAHACLLSILAVSVVFSPSPKKIRQSYYKVDRGILRAGEFVQNHTRPDETLATAGEVMHDLLWASGRTGWTVSSYLEPELFFLERPWRRAAVAFEPGRDTALSGWFLHRPCVAFDTGIAIFDDADDAAESDGDSLGFKGKIMPTRPPLVFRNGLRILGAAVEAEHPGADPDAKPTTATVAVLWRMPAAAMSLDPWNVSEEALTGAGIAAVRWRRMDGADEPLVLRLPPIEHAVNLRSEAFTRCQIASAATTVTLPVETGETTGVVTCLTVWRFAIPAHFPSGEYRLELAIRAWGDERLEPIEPGGVFWARLNKLRIPARQRETDGAELDLTNLFFADSPNGRCPPEAALADGSLSLTREIGDVFADVGGFAAPVELRARGEFRPYAHWSVALGTGWEWSEFPLSNKPREFDSVFVPPEDEPHKKAYVEFNGGDILSQTLANKTRQWPLYVDEVPRPPGRVILRSVTVRPREPGEK